MSCTRDSRRRVGGLLAVLAVAACVWLPLGETAPPQPEGDPRKLARYVQIRTTQSPSWIGWAQVELRVARPRFGFEKE